MGFSDIELFYLQLITSTSSGLSIIGCTLVLYKLYSSNPIWNMTNKQLLVICLIDLIAAMFWGVGQYWIDHRPLCQLQVIYRLRSTFFLLYSGYFTFPQGFMIQFGGMCNIIWNSAIAYLLYQWIVLKQNAEKLDKKIKIIVSVCVLLSLANATYLLFDDSYGDATLWCWIDSDHEWYRFFFLYIFLLVSWLFNAIILHLVSRAISNRNQPNSQHLALAEAEIQNKLRQYLFVFILSWFFGLFNRLMQFILDHPIFITSLLHAFFVPLQGFLNSICYGDIFEDCLGFWKNGASMSEISLTSSSFLLSPNQSVRSPSTSSILSFPSIPGFTPSLLHRKSAHTLSSVSSVLPQIAYDPRTLSIFMSTFNQGEATLSEMQSEISGWLPAGHDIYVVGVQECLYLSEFRQVVLEHLGGSSQFCQFTSEIGNTNTRLGFHGYIALTVYIRVTEMESRTIRLIESNTSNVKKGRDLLLTTASNKGAVGLSFQIHNTVVGFITAHFPSDSDGKSKMIRRNEVSQSVLQEVILSDEDTGCDVQFQHDYLFLLGDLNYRLNPSIPSLPSSSPLSSPSSILFNVTSATFTERGYYPLDDYTWYQRKYRLFEGQHSSRGLSLSEEIHMQRSAEVCGEEWAKVLYSDEMLYWMRAGEIFHGFQELPIRFPPTYKRKKGASAGFCGDYTNYGEIIQGFSNLGDQEGEVQGGYGEGDVKTAEGEKVGEREAESVSEGKMDKGDKLGGVGVGMEATTADQVRSLSRPPLAKQHTRNRSDVTSVASNASSNSATTATTSSSALASCDASPKGKVRAGAGGVGAARGAARRATIFPLMKSESFEDKKRSKIRPPSYTDRILFHSLSSPCPDPCPSFASLSCSSPQEGQHQSQRQRQLQSRTAETTRSRLHSMKYGFCDSMRASDHRPVVMTMLLEVNRSILPSGISSTLNSHVVILQLSISQLSVSYSALPPPIATPAQSTSTSNPLLSQQSNSHSTDSAGAPTGAGALSTSCLASHGSTSLDLPPPSPHLSLSPPVPPHPLNLKHLQVIFPISPKDPLLSYRKIYDLSKALNVSDRTGLKLNFKSSQLKEELLQSKRIYPIHKATHGTGIMVRTDLSSLLSATSSSSLQVHSCIDLSSSVEAVVILLDATGSDLGQGVLPLTPLLSADKLNTPQLLSQIPLTSGGKFLGYFSVVCCLKHVQTQISLR